MGMSFSDASPRNTALNENGYSSRDLKVQCKQGYTSALQIGNHFANTGYNNIYFSPTIAAIITCFSTL